MNLKAIKKTSIGSLYDARNIYAPQDRFIIEVFWKWEGYLIGLTAVGFVLIKRLGWTLSGAKPH